MPAGWRWIAQRGNHGGKSVVLWLSRLLLLQHRSCCRCVRLGLRLRCALCYAQMQGDHSFMASGLVVQMPAGDVGEEATAYKEITLASEIARELQVAGFLSASEARDIDTLCLDEGVLEAAGFEAFASFRTNREKYRCALLMLVLARGMSADQQHETRRFFLCDGDGMCSWCGAIGMLTIPRTVDPSARYLCKPLPPQS